MKLITNIIKNRNTLLVVALISALAFPQAAPFFKNYTLYILAVVMIFSTSGIPFGVFTEHKSFLKASASSIFLNYFVHGFIVISLAFLLFDDYEIILGFVVIAATPPGIAVIPFTFILKGDENFSIKGILGAYLAGIIISPLVIEIFSKKSSVNPLELVYTIFQVIIIPILLSRILRHKKLIKLAEKSRGKVADIGFALILYTAVALNRNVIFNDFKVVAKALLILFIAMFVAGFVFDKIMKNKNPQKLIISKNLILTMKSSGFAIATAIALFGEKSAVAPAVMSIFVLLYLLYKGILTEISEKKSNAK